MTTASQRIAEYQRLAAKIEEAFAEGGIGPETRRKLLENARDASKVSEPVNRIAPPPRAQSGKLVGMNDNEINAAKNPHRARKRGPALR